jgi:hypothetical protein
VTLNDWPGQGHLLTTEPNAQLDLDDWIGQRQSSFHFELFDGSTGENLGDLTPYVDGANLTHDATQTIKRQLTLNFGVLDTSDINPLTDRVRVFMRTGGIDFPLGRYMFATSDLNIRSGGNELSPQLVDEMFIVDQQITDSFTTHNVNLTTDMPTINVGTLLIKLLGDLPLAGMSIASTSYFGDGSWTPGTRRGQIVDALTVQGDYMSPWFNHNGILTFIRTVDPTTDVATFDFDAHSRVFQDSITVQSNIINAPNVYVVVGNFTGVNGGEITGRYEIPNSAPYSIFNRGFEIPEVIDLQVSDTAQAFAAAKSIGIQRNIVDTIQCTTPPDPRHDCHDIVIFQGQHWLEIGWMMTLMEGGEMTHTLQRVYR